MDGDLEAAEPMVRAYLLQHGDHVEAMRLLARIGIARKVFDDAELLLAAVLELAPDYRAARTEYAEVLIELHKYPEARRELERLLRERSRQPPTIRDCSRPRRGWPGRARAGDRPVPGAAAGDAAATPDVHLSIAHALKTLGRAQEAIESYRGRRDCRPDFGDAYWSLANLKTYRFTDEELGAACAPRRPTPTIGARSTAIISAFALGKALEDRGEYRRSPSATTSAAMR